MKNQINCQNCQMQVTQIEKQSTTQKAQERQELFSNFYEDAFAMMRQNSLYTVSCQSRQENSKSKLGFAQAFRVSNPTFFQQDQDLDNIENYNQVRSRKGTDFNQLMRPVQSSLESGLNIRPQSMSMVCEKSKNLKDCEIKKKLDLNHEIKKQKFLVDLSKTEVSCIGYLNDSINLIIFRQKKGQNASETDQEPEQCVFELKVLMNESDSQTLLMYDQMAKKGIKVPNIEFLNLEFESVTNPQWNSVHIQIYSSN